MRHLSLCLLAGVLFSYPAFAATSAQPSNQQPQQQPQQQQQPQRSPLPAQEPQPAGPKAGYGGMFINPKLSSQQQHRQPIWPTFQVEQSVAANAGSGGLVLKSTTARITGLTADRTVTPVFQIDARSDAALEMHEEVLGTTESYIAGKHYDGPFALKAMAIPADVVRRGDVTTHVWACNKSPHLVHVAAYLTDTQGSRSNEIRYTIHCNGE